MVSTGIKFRSHLFRTLRSSLAWREFAFSMLGSVDESFSVASTYSTVSLRESSILVIWYQVQKGEIIIFSMILNHRMVCQVVVGKRETLRPTRPISKWACGTLIPQLPQICG